MDVKGKWFMRLAGTVLAGYAAVMGYSLMAEESSSFALMKDGKPNCSIVVDPNGARSARFGACELQWHIKRMTGADIPIVTAPEPQTQGFLIYVGDSPALKAVEGFSSESFKSQEYVVSVKPGRIVLAGKDSDDKGAFTYNMDDPLKMTGIPDLWVSNGSLYAVYDFLERSCGVRWFNQTESGTFIPDTENLSVPCGELRRTPAFIYRNACYSARPNSHDSYNQYVALWKSDAPEYKEWDSMAYSGLRGKYTDDRQYTNARGNLAHLYLLRSRCGGERIDCNHSFYGYYDRFWEQNPKRPGVFEGSRPEYFAQGYDPKAQPPNLCYTNQALIKQVAKDAADYYDGKKSGQELSISWCPKLPNPFPLEPMDCTGYCKCDNCAKFLKAKERTGDSDYWFTFVNNVSKELKKTHPDASLITLAYSTHSKLPSFELEPNINVQYCFGANRMPYGTFEYESGLAGLAEWAKEKKISGRQLGLWLYYCYPLEGARNGGFNCFPAFFAHTIAKQMKLFQNYGIYGMFHCGYGQEVEAYVTFRLMNDPSLDIDTLLEEYFMRMYGKAAEPMRQMYLEMEKIYCDPLLRPKERVGGPALNWGCLGTSERMEKWGGLLAEADKLADTGVVRQRLALFRKGTWDYMKEGLAKYLKSRTSKTTTSFGVCCPFVLGEAPNGDLKKVDWRDTQEFDGFNGGLKDDGDISLRKISGKMAHDGKWLYLALAEDAPGGKPSPGDTWEILLPDRQSDTSYNLFIDSSGKITGRTVKYGGIPQEWREHGASALTKAVDNHRETLLALPIPVERLDKNGALFMNCRRNHATGEDSPVWVATGGDFESGKTGVFIYFDKAPVVQSAAAPSKKPIMDWDFSGTGRIARDRSSHGNDGIIVGTVNRVNNGVEFTDGDQYVEAASLKGRLPEKYTLSFWLMYPKANHAGGMPILSLESFRVLFVAVPYQKILINWKDSGGKVVGRGPTGVELTPRIWHMLTLVNDGDNVVVYENGRSRISFKSNELPFPGPDAVLRFGGEPKNPAWKTFLGTLRHIQLYDRSLPPEEVLSKYQAEFPEYRANPK
ncbi:MAG: DUF4838 domain-containing protein [Victivallales bacterium]